MLFRRLSLRRWRLALVLLVVLAIAGVGLAFIHPAAAQTLQETATSGNKLGEAIFLILNTILWGMTKLFSMMTFIFVSILVVVARYNTFLNAPVVQSGWPIVRDLMNMLFIIALIIIAAGTVLRLQNYRYNRLLGKLIIMAFLVNFSKFIAVFLLQFAQVVMLTFVNAFREAAFGNFSSMFGLDSVFQFSSTGTTGGGGFSIFISMIAGLAMMIVAFVVTLSMTVMLFVRIIALWLLIILSPIAYAMRILPNTEKYASQWWAEFTKYAVLGPVLAFFLWLALAVVAATPSCSQLGCNNPLGTDPAVKADMATVESDQQKSGVRGDLVTNILSVDKMVTFVVSIIFLMMGMQYAQKSGAAGAAFAGKVASAGFGIAGGITGYNAIKDRTVAPIQGWLKNRQAARQSAIQERTETVEAAGDRVKGRFGLTQGARERGTAAANAYERNRTARTAQKQGYKDMDDEDLQGKFQTSTNQRERLAAMTELSNRGHIDLNDEDQNKAFEDLTNYQRERKLGFLPAYPLADAELPKGERQQLREKILDQNIKSQDEATLRQHASMKDDDPTKDAALRDRRIRSTQELDRRQLLKANDDGDAGLVSQLENDVRGIPEKHRQFKENLMKSSPDMAMRVLFNNLERPKHVAGDLADEVRADLKHRENMEAYKSAIQQKQISTSSMSKGLYDSLGTGPEGLKVKKELAQHLIDISPDAETLQSYWKGMDSEAAHMFGKHINMGDDPNIDRRNMAAKVTGEWGRAFQDKDGNPLYMGEDGKPMTQASATANPSKVKKDDKERPVLLGQDYFDKLGGDEVLKTLTPEAIKSARVQEMMRRSPNWTFSNSATLRTRSAESREAQTVGLQAGMAEILTRHSGAQDPVTGKIDFAKITNENEKAEVISMAQQLFLASKGATNPYDMTEGSDGAKLFASTISGAKAADYSKIAKSVDYDKGSEQYKKDVHVAIGRNGKPGELSDLLLMDREFTEEVLKDTQQVLKEELNGDEDTAGKAHNVLRRLANQEGFNNIISYTPSEYRGKSSESEKGSAGEKSTGGGKAGAATAAAAAGAVIGAAAGSRAAREAAAAEPWKAGAKIVLPPGVSIDDDEPEGPDEPPTPPTIPPPTPPPPTGGSTPPGTPPTPQSPQPDGGSGRASGAGAATVDDGRYEQYERAFRQGIVANQTKLNHPDTTKEEYDAIQTKLVEDAKKTAGYTDADGLQYGKAPEYVKDEERKRQGRRKVEPGENPLDYSTTPPQSRGKEEPPEEPPTISSPLPRPSPKNQGGGSGIQPNNGRDQALSEFQSFADSSAETTFNDIYDYYTNRSTALPSTELSGINSQHRQALSTLSQALPPESGVRLSEDSRKYWQFAHTNKGVDTNQPVGRIYFNLKPEQTAAVFEQAAREMAQQGLNVQMKIPQQMNGDTTTRADKMVMYFDAQEEPQVLAAVEKLHNQNQEAFISSSPRMTVTVPDQKGQPMNGIAFGEEPKLGGPSFGEIRSRILSAVLEEAKSKGKKVSDTDFDANGSFRRAATYYGVDPDLPAFNASTEGAEHFSEIRRRLQIQTEKPDEPQPTTPPKELAGRRLKSAVEVGLERAEKPTSPPSKTDRASTPKPVPTPAPAPKTPEVPPVRPAPKPKTTEPKTTDSAKPAPAPKQQSPEPTRAPEATPSLTTKATRAQKLAEQNFSLVSELEELIGSNTSKSIQYVIDESKRHWQGVKKEVQEKVSDRSAESLRTANTALLVRTIDQLDPGVNNPKLQTLLDKILNTNGLQRIAPRPGEGFNPKLHEPIGDAEQGEDRDAIRVYKPTTSGFQDAETGRVIEKSRVVIVDGKPRTLPPGWDTNPRKTQTQQPAASSTPTTPPSPRGPKPPDGGTPASPTVSRPIKSSKPPKPTA